MRVFGPPAARARPSNASFRSGRLSTRDTSGAGAIRPSLNAAMTLLNSAGV
jgi:hypothetical protein